MTNESQCDQCKKVFKNKRDLERHVRRVHVKRDVHKCDICKKELSCILNLRLHKQTQHSDVFFSCQTCTFTTRNENSLKEHKLLHSKGVPTEKCPNCSRYIVRKNLRSHILRLHMEPLKPSKNVVLGKSIKNAKTFEEENVKNTDQHL